MAVAYALGRPLPYAGANEIPTLLSNDKALSEIYTFLVIVTIYEQIDAVVAYSGSKKLSIMVYHFLNERVFQSFFRDLYLHFRSQEEKNTFKDQLFRRIIILCIINVNK